MSARQIDRRRQSRDAALYQARRRYPRLRVKVDVFYLSEEANVFAEQVNVSLRGLFLPCRFPDAEGSLGTAYVDLGEGRLVKAAVEVVRALEEQDSPAGRRGMALRIRSMAEADRLRLAAFLLRRGGLSMIPQLGRRFCTLALCPRRPEALGQAA